MRQVLVVILALSAGLWLAGLVPASAASITATITADNHYGLYYGAANGTGLTLVGRNEFGDDGSPGNYNWSLPETWTVNVPAGSRLFVLAWTDDGGPQSWIGEFTLPGNKKLYSNLTDWQYMVANGSNPGRDGDLPSLLTVQNDIATGAWAAPLASTPNGTGILSDVNGGPMPDISLAANYIWHDTLDDTSGSDLNYVIFRTDSPVVPLSFNQGPVVTPAPSTLLLVGSSLVGLALLGRRKFTKAGN